jgi:hypothetical protein
MNLPPRVLAKGFSAIGLALVLISCGGGGGNGGPGPQPFTVGGTVSGLAPGDSVVLLNNGFDSVTVTSNTTFTFPVRYVSGLKYAVTLGTQPTGQTCTITDGSGVIGYANITNISVACTANQYAIGGTVSGLNAGGLSVTDGIDSISVAAGATSIAFPTPLDFGSSYTVKVAAQPAGELCNVANSSGTIGAANVSNIAVTCAGHNVWALRIPSGSGHYGTLGVASPDNLPPARTGGATWTDGNGNLWLFGGSGGSLACDSGGVVRNDLWKYSPSTNEWTWVSGSSGPCAVGVYGTLGVAAAGNVPGARNNAASWTDGNGNLWLFGGYVAQGAANDLWMYSPSTNEWTWVNGSSSANSPGVTGTQGVSAAGNLPSARGGALSWIDMAGNLWLFGGSGLGDLWVYAPSTGWWTWVNGSPDGSYPANCSSAYDSNPPQPPPPGCTPAPRTGAVAWTDLSGNFWLADGLSPPLNPAFFGYLTDLWEYVPGSGAWQWKEGAMAPANGAVGWTDSSNNLWLFGGSFKVPTQPVTYNGLAEYTISTGQWSSPSAPTIAPAATDFATSWIGIAGSFWLFPGSTNDLWQYLP